MTLDDRTLARAVEALASRVPVAAVLLFGSAATARAMPDSDVDVAVLARGPIEPLLRLDLQADLEGILGSSVDLVDLARASPILAMQILRHGRRLATFDRRAFEAFLVRTLTEYEDVKIARRPIEAALLARRAGDGR